jgi:methanol metabolism-related c-type cytochrome
MGGNLFLMNRFFTPQRLWTGGAAAIVAAVSVVALAGSLKAADEIETDPYEKPYVVDEGKVDRGTYNGYRRYHSSCHVCHGPDGLGSSFAPALTESLKRLSYDQFIEVIANGRASAGATGDKVMPSFGTDQNVMLYLEDLYGYLKARSDGALNRGRPERLQK